MNFKVKLVNACLTLVDLGGLWELQHASLLAKSFNEVFLPCLGFRPPPPFFFPFWEEKIQTWVAIPHPFEFFFYLTLFNHLMFTITTVLVIHYLYILIEELVLTSQRSLFCMYSYLEHRHLY